MRFKLGDATKLKSIECVSDSIEHVDDLRPIRLAAAMPDPAASNGDIGLPTLSCENVVPLTNGGVWTAGAAAVAVAAAAEATAVAVAEVAVWSVAGKQKPASASASAATYAEAAATLEDVADTAAAVPVCVVAGFAMAEAAALASSVCEFMIALVKAW